jgi:hypothetical protein
MTLCLKCSKYKLIVATYLVVRYIYVIMCSLAAVASSVVLTAACLMFVFCKYNIFSPKRQIFDIKEAFPSLKFSVPCC